MIATTTLNKLDVDHDWLVNLMCSLYKIKPDDAPLMISEVLTYVGLEDAISCLRFTNANQKDISYFALWCAKQAQKYTNEARVITAIEVAERFLSGEATASELSEANHAVRAAKVDHFTDQVEIRAPIECAIYATNSAQNIFQASENAYYASKCALDAAWGFGLRKFDRTKFNFDIDSAKSSRKIEQANQEAKFKEMFCEESHA